MKKLLETIAGTIGLLIIIGAILLAWPFFVILGCFLIIGWFLDKASELTNT